MPRPPDWDGLFDLKFITNYALIGCDVDPWLFLEFSHEPAEDLLLLFIVPDLSDIVQAIFLPKGQRGRKAARHGRKKRPGFGLPDPSDVIGQGVRAHVNPGDALNFGPIRMASKVFNSVELLNYTVAVAEGLTTTGFEGLWGPLNVDHNLCLDLDRLERHDVPGGPIGGPGGTVDPIPMDVLTMNHGFFDGRFGTTCINGPFALAFNVVASFDFPGDAHITFGLWDEVGQLYDVSQTFYVSQGQTVSASLYADVPAGKQCFWGCASPRAGYFTLRDATVIAFGLADWPWPW